jgi:xanthine dehydrogenase accessory factor
VIAFYETLQALLRNGTPCVCVTMVDSVGSVPQEVGARMLVTQAGLCAGTVGGGKLEKRALEEAQALLSADGTPKPQLFKWRLDTDIGMTCGGSVTLFFEPFYTQPWRIVVFGAGHIAQVVVRQLLNLSCQVTCIDPRPEWLDKLPESPGLSKRHCEDMPSLVAEVPEGAFVLLMTMGHGTDWPILREILRTRTFPYVGVIGSRAKAVRLKRDITEAGLPESCQEMFFCPMGLPLGNNQPEEIAISIVAQLLQERDRAKG